MAGFPEGDYTAEIIAKDKWGNEREITRAFSVQCVEKVCEGVSPESMLAGAQNVSVTITAEDTNFVQGETFVSFDCEETEVSVDSVTVDSPTQITVVVSSGAANGSPTESLGDARKVMAAVASNAQDDYAIDGEDEDGEEEKCNINITGADTVVCEEAFTISSAVDSTKACLGIDPSVIKAGDRDIPIIISGQNTSFNDNTNVS
ncbi:unnamed protein product, partial [marine sediment metagenome]